MTSRYSRSFMSVAVPLLTGAVLLVAACGGSAETITTAAVETATTTSSAAGESGSIVLKGMIDNPMTLTVMDMDYMDVVTITADRPEFGATEYTGVRLSEVSAAVGVQPDATTLVITGSDGSKVEISLADITSKDAMIAVGDDSAMNAVMPGLESKTWVQDVVSMEFK